MQAAWALLPRHYKPPSMSPSSSPFPQLIEELLQRKATCIDTSTSSMGPADTDEANRGSLMQQHSFSIWSCALQKAANCGSHSHGEPLPLWKPGGHAAHCEEDPLAASGEKLLCAQAPAAASTRTLHRNTTNSEQHAPKTESRTPSPPS